MSINNYQQISNQTFTGERPLFKASSLELDNCTFIDGESAGKFADNISITNSNLGSKYLFWHATNITIKDTYFPEEGRASVWYADNITLQSSKVDAPKIFRDAQNITIVDTKVNNSNDTLWDCDNVTIKDSEFSGDYLLLHSNNISVENFTLDGNYSFQHVKNLVMRNVTIKSKDPFWNSEDITVYDSVIYGEYLGWYSKNLKLINCKIIGTQPLCYAKGLVLENCEMIDTDLAFEDSEVEATITTSIESVKNPKSGTIRAKEIKELILDDDSIDMGGLQIVVEKETMEQYAV